MTLWEKPLTRENLDEFFHMFAAPAYRSAYKILGDSTRTENALTESFLEVYHKRNSEDYEDLVFLFSDILQRRVENLAVQYPLTETSQTANKSIDEFTENSILAEIHRRIDSTPYRILEIFTSTAAAGKSGVSTDPVIGQLRKTGITLFLILQLIVAAILVYAVTYTSASSIFGVDSLAPQNPDSAEIAIEDLLVPALNYLPLIISGQETEPSEITSPSVPPDESGQTASVSESASGEATVSASNPASQSVSGESTVASATRG